MKIICLTVYSFVLIFSTKAQDANLLQLLEKMKTSTDRIRFGQYTFHNSYTKQVVGEDTTRSYSTAQCFFEPNPQDKLTGYKFTSIRKNGAETLYDGLNLYSNITWTKTLTVTDIKKYPAKITEEKIVISSYPYPFFKSLAEEIYYYKKNIGRLVLTGYEMVATERCYKLKQVSAASTNGTQASVFYYVSVNTNLPVKQTVILDRTINKAREIQLFEYWISDLRVNNNKSMFSISALSPYNKQINYNGPETSVNKLLAAGVTAPEWELPLLSNKTVKLSDLKGKIVIMDFWYKACAPCQQQMMVLQKLHDKFDQSKVAFIGINSYDDPVKDKIDLFLKNRAITMTTVWNGKNIEKAYKVYSHPALYVIDQQGKIIYALDGYSDSLVADLNKIIVEHL